MTAPVAGSQHIHSRGLSHSLVCIQLFLSYISTQLPLPFSKTSIFHKVITIKRAIELRTEATPHSTTMPRSYSSDCAESGYASGSSSASLPEVYFSRPHLKFINQQLQNLEPQDILKWCITTLPRLYQTTAFGLTGLAINDMVSKLDGPIKPQIDLIYLVSSGRCKFLQGDETEINEYIRTLFTLSKKHTICLTTSRGNTLTLPSTLTSPRVSRRQRSLPKSMARSYGRATMSFTTTSPRSNQPTAHTPSFKSLQSSLAEESPRAASVVISILSRLTTKA